MNEKEFEDYLAGRYQDQINWHCKKAMRNKNYYYFFQWLVLILSVVLPVLTTILVNQEMALLKWSTVFISILLAIGTGAMKTFKFQENWINYRNVSEEFKKREIFL